MKLLLLIVLIQILYILNSSAQLNKGEGITAVANNVKSTVSVRYNKTVVICKYILILNIIQIRVT